MKKSFVTALAVALLGAMTLGAVASSASAPHKPAKNIVQTAVAAGSFKTLVSLVKQAGLAGALSGTGAADRVRTDGRGVREGAEGDARRTRQGQVEAEGRPALPRGEGQAHGGEGRQAAAR